MVHENTVVACRCGRVSSISPISFDWHGRSHAAGVPWPCPLWTVLQSRPLLWHSHLLLVGRTMRLRTWIRHTDRTKRHFMLASPTRVPGLVFTFGGVSGRFLHAGGLGNRRGHF